jgi:cell division protein YceG involved in septum cleavage
MVNDETKKIYQFKKSVKVNEITIKKKWESKLIRKKLKENEIVKKKFNYKNYLKSSNKKIGTKSGR